MDRQEIEKKLHRVEWIRNVINNHLDDVKKILESVLDDLQDPTKKSHNIVKGLLDEGASNHINYEKWSSYNSVMEGLLEEYQDPGKFSNLVGKLLYAMTMNNVPATDAKRFVDELLPNTKHPKTRIYIQQRLKKCYPELKLNEEPTQP